MNVYKTTVHAWTSNIKYLLTCLTVSTSVSRFAGTPVSIVSVKTSSTIPARTAQTLVNFCKNIRYIYKLSNPVYNIGVYTHTTDTVYANWLTR